MTGAELLVIPLVALLIPIALLLGALVFDALFISWIAYQAWHERVHAHWSRLPNRSL
jgi:uncharacterized membrane protein YfcA